MGGSELDQAELGWALKILVMKKKLTLLIT